MQISFFSKCQGQTIYDQLEDGFRYLDIRLGVGTEDGETGLYLMHGFTYCKKNIFPWSDNYDLDSLLDQCYRFLQENPTETIVFMAKYEHGDLSNGDVEKLLDGYIEKNEDQWLLTDTIPTVGEARGKLVLFRRYGDDAGLGSRAGIQADWWTQEGSDDVSLASSAFENENLTTFVQDRYEYGTEDKWNAFLKGLEETKDVDRKEALCIHFLSTKGTWTYGHAYSFARKLNSRFLSKDLPEGCSYGWTIFDFGNAKLAEKVYRTNF